MPKSKTARLLYQMTLECRGHGFASSCKCEARIAEALADVVVVDRERRRDGTFSRDWPEWLRAVSEPDGMAPRVPVSLRLLADEMEAAGA